MYKYIYIGIYICGKFTKTSVMRHIYISPILLLSRRDNRNMGEKSPLKNRVKTMPDMIGTIVGLFIVAILGAALLPTALSL
jgi:hypothetical protein